MSTKKGTKTDEYKSVFGNARKGNSAVQGSADWSSAESTAIARLVEAVTSRGGAVRFGYTRDGGAYALGLYYGQDSKTDYCRPSEDLAEFLEGWILFYEDLPNTRGKSPDQG